MDSPEDKFSKVQKDNYLLIVQSNGNIKWQFQTLSKSFCKIDILNFPFDEQVCSINVRSSGRDNTMIRIIQRNLKVKVYETIQTEWFITNSTVEEDSLIITRNNYTESEYSVLKFSMKLRRVTTYYFLKIIFPFSIITSVTLFTFWLAPDSSEKLTLNVTVLLSLVIYLQIISEYIPRGFNQLPLLSLFSLTNFCLVYLSSVFSVLVLRLYYKRPTFMPPIDNQLPYIFRLILFKYVGRLMMLKFHCRERNEHYTLYDCVNTAYCNGGGGKLFGAKHKKKVMLLAFIADI